jgi:hypothetical protein
VRQKKSNQPVCQGKFTESEREDIEQEFRLHLLCWFSKFDPAIAHWNVFVHTLVERHWIGVEIKQTKLI